MGNLINEAKIFIEFNVPENADNLVSAESLSTMMGKIYKHIDSHHKISYSGDFNDLDNAPVVDISLDASSENAICNKAVTEALQGCAVLVSTSFETYTDGVSAFLFCNTQTSSTEEIKLHTDIMQSISSNLDNNISYVNAIEKPVDTTNTSITVEQGNGGFIIGNYDNDNFVSGANSIAVGESNKITGMNSGSVGNNNTITGINNAISGTDNECSGDNDIVSGTSNYIFGSNLMVSGSNNYIDADADNSSIIGNGNSLIGKTNQHAEGSNNIGQGENSHVEGYSNITVGSNSHSEGSNNLSYAQDSHTEGGGCKAYVDQAHAEGCRTVAGATVANSSGDLPGKGAHSEGYETEAFGNNAHAEGNGTKALSSNSHAEGYMTVAGVKYNENTGGQRAHAEGYQTKALGANSHSQGRGTIASSSDQHAQGRYNIEDTTGTYAFILGNGTSTNRSNAMTVDWDGNLSMSGSVTSTKFIGEIGTSASTTVMGGVKVDGTTIKISSGVISGVGINKAGESFNNTYTVGYDDSTTTVSGTVGTASEIFNNTSNIVGTGTYAHAEGYLTTAIGNNAHAEGNATVATNSGTHAEGYMTTASGTQAHAEGNRTLASGTQAHAEGYKTKASGSYSHAEGYQTSVSDIGSHVEGYMCTSSGDASSYGNHVEGYTNTFSSGSGNHVEGYMNTITGTDRASIHVGGIKCTSSKNFSYVHGIHLTVDNSGGLNGLNVVGQYNNTDLSDSTVNNALFVIGNGKYNGTETSLINYAESDMTRSNAVVICGDRSNFYNDVYAMSNNYIVDRLSGAGENKGFWLYANGSALAGIYTGGSNCYLGGSDMKFYRSYITEMYGTVKGTADYAEYMEWSDGNPDNEDRRGLLVTYDDSIDEYHDSMIKLANKSDDIIGIVSSNPLCLGDCYDDEWHGKYKTDVFGKTLYNENIIQEATYDDNGNVIDEAVIKKEPILSDDYDDSKKYIPREERPEWSPIGFLGKLVCIDDGTCVQNKYVTAINGVATLSVERTNILMLRRIDDDHIRVLIR